jgi:hypothetical protein
MEKAMTFQRNGDINSAMEIHCFNFAIDGGNKFGFERDQKANLLMTKLNSYSKYLVKFLIHTNKQQ